MESKAIGTWLEFPGIMGSAMSFNHAESGLQGSWAMTWFPSDARNTVRHGGGVARHLPR